MRTRVMVLVRHQLMREGLAALLRDQPDQMLVGQSGNGLDGTRLAAELRPDVVLMDMDLPGLNGVDATRRIVGASPSSRVLCLVSEQSPQTLRAALDAGVRGILAKDSSGEELIRAIAALAQRQYYFSASLTETAIQACRDTASQASVFARLTPKEREIVQLLAEGHSPKQIAVRLDVSYKTVASHREHAAAKLGLRGMADLTRYAIREGLVGC